MSEVAKLAVVAVEGKRGGIDWVWIVMARGEVLHMSEAQYLSERQAMQAGQRHMRNLQCAKAFAAAQVEQKEG